MVAASIIRGAQSLPEACCYVPGLLSYDAGMSQDLPEPWLRGPVEDAHPVVGAVLHSFQQAREDLAKWTEGLSPEELWARPAGVTPVGAQIRHIAGSVDRLSTYLQGLQLSDTQLLELKREAEAGANRRELLDSLDSILARVERLCRGLDPAAFADARAVGRKRLPTTVIGLLIHMAEHTQRHVGQAIVTAKVVRGRNLERA
jgi:hypothetical protein